VSDVVVDSSAVLALLFDEPGARAVLSVLPGALLSTVNFAEIIAKLTDRGMASEAARRTVEAIGVELADFDADQAWLSGDLKPLTGPLGLSLGDRACLALARARGLPALTADSAWTRVAGVEVRLIR
jgi:PIN domain nuclease of toxin-antitoxin system